MNGKRSGGAPGGARGTEAGSAGKRKRGLHPAFTPARATAGVVGGVAGGLVFGLLMAVKVIGRGETSLEGAGVLPALAEVLGTTNMLVAWVVHVANSALFGLAFSLVVVPRRFLHAIAWGLAWGVALWFFGATLVLGRLTGEPFRIDGAAIFSLQGHVLFGLTLGIVYVWFHGLIVEEAHAHHVRAFED